MKAIPLLGSLLLAACASSSPAVPPAVPPAAPPVPSDPPKAGTAPAPEIPAPAVLAEGDRWFVAVRADTGPEPMAERSRRTRGDGFVREEVTWARSFATLAGMEHGTAQVFALFLDGKGLSISRIDDRDRPVGEAGIEVAAPFRGGTSWTVGVPGGAIEGRVVGIEKVETPGGPVEALRVEVSARNMLSRIWYDAGLRPVRAEVRRGASEVLESRAALASPSPAPEECRAAVEWARKNLPAPGRN